jgi:hypothetical protein
MAAHMTLNLLLASAVLLHVAIAVILVRQYLRTRDIGLVWLGAAVVVWPLVSRLLEAGERVSIDRAIHKQSVIYPFTLVASGQTTIGSLVMSFAVFQELIGVCLLLVAVLYLSKSRNHTIRPIA